MPDANLERRLEMLESTVDSLRKLPAEVKQLRRLIARAESQIRQQRTEMRAEFSAMRRDMATKADLARELTSLRAEMATRADLAAGLSAVRAEMATKAELTAGLSALRDELRGEFSSRIEGAVRELSGRDRGNQSRHREEIR